MSSAHSPTRALFAMKYYPLLLLLPALCLSANIERAATDDVAFVNGGIYTVDGANWDQNYKEGIVIKNGKIAFLGTTAQAENFAAANGVTSIIDLNGKTILPGIHDVHQHPLEAMSSVTGTCILPSDKAPDSPEIINILKTCRQNQIGTEWVLGWGHSITSLLDYAEAGKNPMDILNEHMKDDNGNPLKAIMMEATSHSAWVNQAALDALGVTADSKLTGGVLMLNATGQPNGIVLENWVIEFFDHALDPDVTGHEQLKNYAYEGLKAALPVLAKNGITSVCSARAYWKRGNEEAWTRAEQDGLLTARAVLGMWMYPGMDDDDAQIAALKTFYSDDKSKLLRRSQLKVYMDGILTSNTAAVLSPGYRDEAMLGLPAPVNKLGFNYFTESRLAKYIEALQSLNGGPGFDFHIHSIGDRATREALNAIESKWMDGTRHRLTHVELVDPADIPRFKELNVVADAQLAGDFTMDHSENDFLVGPTKAKNSIPVKSLVAAGAKVTLSSDWDVSPVNPFIGMQHAITRTPQNMSLKQAIESYTINGAYVMRQEDITGSLVVGKEADLIVVDKDPFLIAPTQIKSIKVLLTMLKGKEVYKDPNAGLDASDYYDYY